jgi:hypothetical protein
VQAGSPDWDETVTPAAGVSEEELISGEGDESTMGD